jgi:hypothetical protein
MTLNAVASRAAKDRGQQLALDLAGEEWKTSVLVELRAWCAVRRAQGYEDMTMEQFRAEAKNHPASFRAWGPLPVIACRAGILAPMNHPDGSPVMGFAESVKTHRHPVRRWKLLSSAHPQPATSCPPNLQDAIPSEGKRQPFGSDDVSAGRHGGDSAGLLAAVAEFHRGRAAG